MRQRLLTASEAAARAAVSRQAMNMWMRAGLIAGERRGRWWFVDAASLDQFLRGRNGRDGRIRGQNPGVDHADPNPGRHSARESAPAAP
jgi:hypothetical protein